MSSVAQAALGTIDAGGGARGARWSISSSSSIAQRTCGSTAAAAEGCGTRAEKMMGGTRDFLGEIARLRNGFQFQYY
jgi:hypothetical protein